MFSEYASRFLAQSQSRLASQPEGSNRTRGDGNRRPQSNFSRYNASRSFLNRNDNPYNATTSQTSHFPFASRSFAQQAPLFHSVTDEFREEDDEHEHEREIADYYALQRSRRHFGNSHLEESSELDDDEEDTSQHDGLRHTSSAGNGIRSSWREDAMGTKKRTTRFPPTAEIDEIDERSEDHEDSPGKGKMVDVGLDAPTRDKMGALSNSASDFISNDVPVQQFRKQPDVLSDYMGDQSTFIPETDRQALLQTSGHPSSEGSSIPLSMAQAEPEIPSNDAFWGHLFILSLTGLFATAFLVYLHTALPPDGKWKLGDTIYTTIHKSYFLLGIYTMVSIFVSLLWLALLRAYVRFLVYTMIIAVPTILYSFSLYPFISSFSGFWKGQSLQDKMMRWGSVIPFILSTLWIYAVVRNRHATGKAISILEFACRVLAVNPALLALGLFTLGITVTWTWLWMIMFTRVFLAGHVASNSFVISVSSWWLGIYFVLVYLWSLGIISGIQRCVTAATVSQWYFHRLTQPNPTSTQVVKAAITHAFTTLFGSISLSSLLALLLRLPIIVLPRRISSIITLFAYSLIPTPVAALVNPLALTYAAIHSQPLAQSARGLTQLAVFSTFTTSTLYPPSISRDPGDKSSLLPYRLSRLILHACRFAMSLALGFGGWVTTARSLDVIGNNTFRGSLYAYVIGLIASAIGWGVLGAMENVLASVVDAAIVCWASEVGNSEREARYCREAEWLFRDTANSTAVSHWSRV
ncbi:hypothetical protein BGW36DRAFT_348843 [Talaromyces proteolyticus]|uniref:Protein PNS1 n=1 Tax=Talaromyces proteolyticus TaxID=1131652 RepID=A0AAD4PVR9_9EURO|nr:uncharacterized protein BGW36DRAFT_348843 [Talaromyces proteolyticus]KAH8691102.1 hypothetical protein BGW36DRAFT_348843 [Talaromyces proteolyticus]